MRVYSLSVAGAALLTFSSAAYSQLTITGNPNGSAIGFASPLPDYYQVSTSVSNTGGHLSLRVRGDYFQTLPTGSSDTGASSSWLNLFAGVTFHIGTFPVQLTNITMHANGKIVNGGGGPAGSLTPDTRLSGTFGIYQNVNSDPRFDPVLSQGAFATELLGNGLREFNETYTPFVGQTPVLGSGQDYHASLYIALRESWTGFTASMPTMVVTHEFGGASNYDGYTLEFDWATVPTPGAGVLLCVAGVGAFRRRR